MKHYIKVKCAFKWARKLQRKTETYESAKCVPCNTRKCTRNRFVSVLLSGHLSVGFMQPGPARLLGILVRHVQEKFFVGLLLNISPQ